jgi:probable F420-dependent oxidoreductase
VKLAATYPTLDLGTDPGVLRAWARGVEDLGFHDLLIPEHVVGIDTGRRPEWRPLNPTTLKRDNPIYDHRNPFFEPCVVMGFLAAVTSSIRITSGVLVLPQRQTALVAKQLAMADVLSGGRVRLGVGAGWNDAEFEALGADYRTRGRRMDEQIGVLRSLWTQESVSFAGEFHELDAVGLCPLPVQRPIPIIIGGDSDAAMRRAVRHGDGWFLTSHVSQCRERVQRMWNSLRDAGRSPDGMSLIGTVQLGASDASEVLDQMQAWHDLGAAQINVRTAGVPARAGSASPRSGEPDDHVAALEDIRRRWAEERESTAVAPG